MTMARDRSLLVAVNPKAKERFLPGLARFGTILPGRAQPVAKLAQPFYAEEAKFFEDIDQGWTWAKGAQG